MGAAETLRRSSWDKVSAHDEITGSWWASKFYPRTYADGRSSRTLPS